MLIGERELRNEIAANKLSCDDRYAQLLASVIGGAPEWSIPRVNGIANNGTDSWFDFEAGALLTTVTFDVNPLVYVTDTATGAFLVGAVPAGTLALDDAGKLIITFDTPAEITAGDVALTIPLGEFITLGGKPNEETVLTLTFVAEVGAPV